MGAIIALSAFIGTTFAVVFTVGFGLLTEFKTYAGIFEKMLSAIILMLYSTSVFGAMYVGNKLFAMALTPVEPEALRRC